MYPPGAVEEELDLKWLRDTGIVLGEGRQGMVRLMLLGGSREVAVKIVRRGEGKFDSFDHEVKIWRELQRHQRQSCVMLEEAVDSHNSAQDDDERRMLQRSFSSPAPRIYGIAVSSCGSFGAIVTEVGSCLTDYLNIAYPEDTRPLPGTEAYAEFLQGEIVPIYVPQYSSFERCDCLTIEKCHKAAWRLGCRTEWPSIYGEKEEAVANSKAHKSKKVTPVEAGHAAHFSQMKFKLHIIQQMKQCVQQLQDDVQLFHRDLKVSNFLLMPDGTVKVCDFGVSKLMGDDTKIPRGAQRMYPIHAIDSQNYDHSCDQHFLACSIFEILSEAVLYEECGADVQSAIRLRRKGEMPQLSDKTLLEFSSSAAGEVGKGLLAEYDEVHQIWQEHAMISGDRKSKSRSSAEK